MQACPQIYQYPIYGGPHRELQACNFLFSSVRFTSLVFIGKIFISGFFPNLPPSLLDTALNPPCQRSHLFLLIKNKIKFSSYIRKFRGIGCKVIYDKRPPHIWWKYLCISSYIRKPFLIYDFAPDPIWISLSFFLVRLSQLSTAAFSALLNFTYIFNSWLNCTNDTNKDFHQS